MGDPSAVPPSRDLSSDRLDEIAAQIEHDRRDGYPTLLAEQLIRELRDARAENQRLAEQVEQKRGGQIGYFAAAMTLESERDKARNDRDSFARMYARSIERYDDLGMGVIRRIADGGSLADVLNFVGDSLNECDHVDAESIALWERAAAVVAALTEGGAE